MWFNLFSVTKEQVASECFFIAGLRYREIAIKDVTCLKLSGCVLLFFVLTNSRKTQFDVQVTISLPGVGVCLKISTAALTQLLWQNWLELLQCFKKGIEHKTLTMFRHYLKKGIRLFENSC